MTSEPSNLQRSTYAQIVEAESPKLMSVKKVNALGDLSSEEEELWFQVIHRLKSCDNKSSFLRRFINLIILQPEKINSSTSIKNG